MNPETKRLIDDLQKQINELRNGASVEQTESLRRRVLQDIISAGTIDSTLTGINETTVVDAGGGNVDHGAPYDRRQRVEIDGVDYYIGLYNV